MDSLESEKPLGTAHLGGLHVCGFSHQVPTKTKTNKQNQTKNPNRQTKKHLLFWQEKGEVNTSVHSERSL